MNATPPTARELFAEILNSIPREEWDGRLAEIRRQDGALADRVEQLLHAHLEPQSFLDKPLAPTVAFTDAAAPGTQIGPYKLREQIGEGGFGVVYVAEQERPIRRKVALKVIKPGMDSREIIARFEAERQALALMDHPNIAKVLDAGATGLVEGQGSTVEGQESPSPHPPSLNSHPSSRPYFVMELVRGVPITDFCDRERLTTAERLRLFIDVCRAVQHAHQKGVIHRDIKPSNVLVTLHDGRPVPKVIDFGVAKALSRPLTDDTLYTGLGQLVGTPMYMSPEQAEMSGLDVDTRSDVYSLGVLLYELLTGSTPFDKETLKKAGFEELRRIIREDEPPRPSARISTLKAELLSTVCDKRRIDPRRLSTHLRGELDWIVMRSLEKDRGRRYESASALAADVERYLDDEPVQACPPSALYRLGKFARRNRTALAAAAVLLLAGLGVGWTVWERGARRGETARLVAETLHETELLRAAAQARGDDLPAWSAALAEARRAASVAAAGSSDAELRALVSGRLAELQREHDAVRARLAEEEKDWRMLAALDESRLARSAVKDGGGGFDNTPTDAAYLLAFQEYGIDVGALSVSRSADLIRASGIHAELVQALLDWRYAAPRETNTERRPSPNGLATVFVDRATGAMSAPTVVAPLGKAGGVEVVSAFNPRFSPDGEYLMYLSKEKSKGSISDFLRIVSVDGRHKWIVDSASLNFANGTFRPLRWVEGTPAP